MVVCHTLQTHKRTNLVYFVLSFTGVNSEILHSHFQNMKGHSLTHAKLKVLDFLSEVKETANNDIRIISKGALSRVIISSLLVLKYKITVCQL